MKKIPRAAWIIWFIAAMFYFYEMLLRVAPGAMTVELMETFQVSAGTLGILTSFYYYSYNFLQTPCGIIVDKVGPRAIITFSCAICVVGAYLFYGTESLGMAQFARFLMGMGSACAFVGTLKLISSWFPTTQFALITGFTVMVGKLGGSSQMIMAPIVSSYGWRTLMFWLVLLGIIMTILCWVIIRNKPHDETEETEVFGLKNVLANKQVWYIGLVGGLMYIPITGFTELWSAPFLMCVCEIDNVTACQFNGLLYIGFALGGPTFATIANRLKSHKWAMIMSCSISLLIFSTICYGAHIFPLYIIRVLYFLGGLSMAGQVLCFTIAKENTPKALGGTTIGFTNTLVMLSALICQPLIGKILDHQWTGLISETGVRIYEKAAYQAASLSIPIGMILCLIILFFIKETYPDKKKH
jgi:MFS family permease